MRKGWLVFLVSLGIIILFGIVGYFPYGAIYEVTLEAMAIMAWEDHPTPHPNIVRLEITLASLVIASMLILFMFLFRKASRFLELKFFEKILSVGMFYVGIMTILMLAGMWIDFRMGQPLSRPDNPSDFCRVGFFFYVRTYLTM